MFFCTPGSVTTVSLPTGHDYHEKKGKKKKRKRSKQGSSVTDIYI